MYDTPRVDSTVRCHHAPGSRRVDPEVHGKDPVVQWAVIRDKFLILLKGEPDPVASADLFHDGGEHIPFFFHAGDVSGVRRADQEVMPAPLLPVVQLQADDPFPDVAEVALLIVEGEFIPLRKAHYGLRSAS